MDAAGTHNDVTSNDVTSNDVMSNDVTSDVAHRGKAGKHTKSSRRHSRKSTKTALVLAGGGLTGAMYEVGALCAMDEMLIEHTVNDFDIYVGTSAGAMVGSLIANRFTPVEAMQVIQNRHPAIDSFNVGDIFYANYEGLLRRLRSLPRVLWGIGRDLLRPSDVAISDIVWELGQLLPTGIYNGASLETFLRRTLTDNGYTNHFARLQKELYIVATELDSGSRAVFGCGHAIEVPISQAVAASSAVPVLFRPFQIGNKDYLDGSLHGAASLDLAIEAGAELIVCVNPLVPLDAERLQPGAHYIRRNGLHTVLNQSVRTLMHSSLRYHIKHLRAKYPHVDIILIQPQWDDKAMFAYNPMHYRSRHEVAQHGFASVTTGFMHNREYFRTVLSRHGFKLAPARTVETLTLPSLDNEHTQFAANAIFDSSPNRLESTLHELQRGLKQLDEIVAVGG